VPRFGFFDGRRRVPTVAFNVFAARFEAPTRAEGFAAIGHVRFVPQFRDAAERAVFAQRS